MYVFGGCTQSSCNAAFNDLWRLDLNSKEWIRPLASGETSAQRSSSVPLQHVALLTKKTLLCEELWEGNLINVYHRQMS